MEHKFSDEEVTYIQQDEQECKAYKQKENRINPFDLNVVWFNITNRIYSKFLQKEIESVSEACEHAKYQIRSWLKEDKSELRKAQNQRYQNKKKQMLVETNPELIVVKNNWRTAIAQRKAAIEQWDSYVDSLQQEYLRAKLKGINRA